MFVLRSTMRAVAADREAVVMAYRRLQRDWNDLVQRVNALGGEQFLQRGEARLVHVQLDDEDIKRLLMLCHPDKHGGKKMAEEMTQKLLALRQR